jgi:hypothetical protein
MTAAEWVTERFRECREWRADDLKTRAIVEGIDKDWMWSIAVFRLPINKRTKTASDGSRYWVWRAVEWWPKELPTERRDDHVQASKV